MVFKRFISRVLQYLNCQNSLSKSAKKILLYWIISAKRKETRQKRVLEVVENASKNLKPKQFR